MSYILPISPNRKQIYYCKLTTEALDGVVVNSRVEKTGVYLSSIPADSIFFLYNQGRHIPQRAEVVVLYTYQ